MLSEVTLGIDTATLLIVLSSAIYGVYFWNKRRKKIEEYDKIMNDPVEFHFFIPHKDLGIVLKYYKQDGEDHEKDELVIPPNFEDHIIMLIRPKLNLLINEWYCGFGTPNSKIPELSYSNVYVMQSSNRSVQWYIDRYGCLHFEVKQQFFKDEVYLGSMKINTFEKGSYPLEVVFNVSSNEYKEIKKEISKKNYKTLIGKSRIGR